VEKAFGADRVTKFLKELNSREIRVRDLDAIFATDAIDLGIGRQGWNGASLYNALPLRIRRSCGSFISQAGKSIDPGGAKRSVGGEEL